MLIVENLRFAYRARQVLSGLSFEAGEGELLGVVGPNGSGKTTLLRLISGVLRPGGGRICLGGLDLASLSPKDRARKVAAVPQNPQLPADFALVDLVLLGRNPHLKLLQWEGPRDMEVARRAMDMTDTLHLADRPLVTLSGGERQRGLVAMALAQEAPLLLLDEPTASLDLAHQAAVMELVSRVQRQRGGAVVVAIHDLTLAALYCDRIVMLAHGHVHADGPPADVITPENISTVYGVQAHVLRHPELGTPVVLPPLRGMPFRSGGGVEGFRVGNVVASNVHLHLGNKRGVVRRFVECCTRTARGGV